MHLVFVRTQIFQGIFSFLAALLSRRNLNESHFSGTVASCRHQGFVVWILIQRISARWLRRWRQHCVGLLLFSDKR